MKDNVWFTYKARIQAHKRLAWLDFHAQLLLVWYAILSTILAVLTVRYPKVMGENTDILATILSVALLGVSLAVANRDFRGRAMLMRDNYLKLHKLYRDIQHNNGTSSEHQMQYHSILSEAENHLEIDDRIARVFSHGLTSRLPVSFEKIQACLWLLARVLITVSLYAAPVIIGIYAWSTKLG
ncbi:SLATT domain-containing protein [Pseudomonas koreensis]|uniref:SLATT domain-containing protein n=1 Tax=Pseudomonas koreensis TaxID=198620 RepID=UPI003208D518